MSEFVTVEEVSSYSKTEGNQNCADCNALDPTWASVNQNVLICTSCSGVHRSLGVEFSFVQSLTLDKWKRESFAQLQSRGSTQDQNVRLEFHVPADFLKPNPNSSREVRERFIREKYVNGGFLQNDSSRSSPLSPVTSPDQCSSVSIGEIQFCGILTIKLIGASNLINMDTFDLSDPYCILTVGKQQFKSKVINDNLNPVWDQTFTFSWNLVDPLQVQCFDKDFMTSDDPLGDASIDLSTVEGGRLCSREGGGEGEGGGMTGPVIIEADLENVKSGRIRLEASFQRL